MIREVTRVRPRAEDTVVAFLRRVHELRRSGGGSPVRNALPALRSSGGLSYDRAREHFVRHEQRLRHEATVSEALIDRLRSEAPPSHGTAGPPQQTLRLQTTDGTAGGRFVVTNERREPVTLRFETSAVSRPNGEALGRAEVALDPTAPNLLPGESTAVRLSLMLPPAAAAGRSELRLDAFAGSERALVLWVEIDALVASGGRLNG